MAQKQRSRQKAAHEQEEEEEQLQQANTTIDIVIGQNENFQSAYHKLSELEAQGLKPSDLKKLANSGYCTIESIAYASTKELAAVDGISEKKVAVLQVCLIRNDR